MQPTNLDIHGIDAPLDEEIHLHAGPLTCVFEPSRGYLRRIQNNGNEILDLIYLHVRAADWSTIMPAVTITKHEIGKDSFDLEWDAHSVAQDIDVVWHGSAKGAADGTIVYRCEGHAVHKTITNRTGVCALIPATYAGRSTVTVTHPDGSKTDVPLPYYVSPVEPLHNYVAATYPGATLTIEGDVYNAEDQRNWTDNSFKAYPICGTRSLYTLQEGQKFLNQITLKPNDLPFPQPGISGDQPETTLFPEIGLAIDGSESDLGQAADCVSFLHVRLPQDAQKAASLVDAASKTGLDLAIEVRGQASHEMLSHAKRVVGLDVHGGPLGQKERDALGTDVVTGAAFFADLNFHGRLEGVPAGVFFGVMPQIHTFDETSILDNARTLEASSRSARALAQTGVSHASLSIATQPDPRLNSQFGAVWLLMCCITLAKGSTASIVASPYAEALASGRPGHIAHLLKKLKDIKGSEVSYKNSDVLTNMVVLSTNKGTIIANRTRQPIDLMASKYSSSGATMTLTSTGWTPREAGAPLGPYEMVSIG